ncbi:MAG: GNAT family N-acetyltransferase [Armatimonadota bacterium]
MVAAGRISYHVLERPFPADFVAWYPYIRPGEIGEGSPWLWWLRRVVHEGVPGVRDRMIAARDDARGEWVGVVWTSVSLACPELAHFGWFLVDDRCRGLGVGGGIIETCLSTLGADGVRMVMLPTQLGNERAIGMYYRRGWRLSIAHPGGDVWMVREPEGFWEEYFTPAPGRPIEAGPPQPADFVALDYLLSRPAAAIRLLPLGVVGSRRFISFTHDWGAASYSVARQAGRPLALAAAVRTDEGAWLDVFGLERRAMATAAAALSEGRADVYADAAVTDRARRGALEDAGLHMTGTREAEIAGAPMTLARYRR